MKEKKRKTAVCMLLAAFLIFAGFGANPAYAHLPDTNKAAYPGQSVVAEPYGIGLVGVQLLRRNSTTLEYRVTATSISGRNTSMSATIILQQLENGRWVNRGNPIVRSAYNAVTIDFASRIDVRAHGSGSYRIVVTFRSVNSGITSVVGPVTSVTVNV